MIKSMSNKELFQLERAERTSRAFSNTIRQNSQDQDVVKIGYLHIKRPPGNTKLRFKAWQKKYFVLRDISFDDGISTLEMFENDTCHHAQPSSAEYTLDLKNVTQIGSYDESKRFSSAFTISCLGQMPPLILGCYSNIEKSVWMEAVNVLADKRKLVYRYKDLTIASQKERQRRSSLPLRIQHEVNLLYSRHRKGSNSSGPLTPERTSGPPTPPRLNSTHSSDNSKLAEFMAMKCDGCLVKIQPGSSASKVGLHGDYYMNVSPKGISLTTVDALQEVINWPIHHINRFKSDDINRGENLLTLDASQLSGSSKGSFEFKTIHGKELLAKVKEAIANDSQKNLPNEIDEQSMPNSNKNHLLNLLSSIGGVSPRVTTRSNLGNNQNDSNRLNIPHSAVFERSHSSPNLLDVRVVFNSHRVKNISGSSCWESKSKSQSLDTEYNSGGHCYLELVEAEKDENNIIRQKNEKNAVLDDEETNDRRDSGFSDTEAVENIKNDEKEHIEKNNKMTNSRCEFQPETTVGESVIIQTTCHNNVTSSPPTAETTHTDDISTFLENSDVDENYLCLNLEKQIDLNKVTEKNENNYLILGDENNTLTAPPPLPPKRRRESSVVFLDYVECTSSFLDSSPPPVPERNYKTTRKQNTD